MRIRISFLLIAVFAQSAAAQTSSAESRTARYLESVRDNPTELLIFLRDMPKGGDLHNHLSGSIFAETFIDWAAQDGHCVDIQTYTLTRAPCDATAGRPPAASAYQNGGLYSALIDAWSMRNWNAARIDGHDQFFDTFGKFGLASGSARTGDMLADVAARAAREGVSYMELMFTPDAAGSLGRAVGYDADLGSLRDKLLAAGLRDTVAKGMRRIDDAFARQRALLRCDSPNPDPGCAVEIRVLYQVLRATTPEQTFAQILAGFELTSRDPRVVGLNLVQPEDAYVAMRDFSLHMRMIGMLRASYPAVKVTLHAGELASELVPPEGLRFHIRESVRVAGANRIGHGVDIAHEDSAVALVQEMARKGVLVEINLSSNAGILGIEGAEHPLHFYMKHNVPVALSTDDMGVSRSSMTNEYRRAVTEQGLGYVTLKNMARNSINYSFADDATKARLLNELNRAFRVLEAKYGVAR